ncbi:MAG: hypothetical protein V3T40_02415 [Nitrososphaerales archaeon]
MIPSYIDLKLSGSDGSPLELANLIVPVALTVEVELLSGLIETFILCIATFIAILTDKPQTDLHHKVAERDMARSLARVIISAVYLVLKMPFTSVIVVTRMHEPITISPHYQLFQQDRYYLSQITSHNTTPP